MLHPRNFHHIRTKMGLNRVCTNVLSLVQSNIAGPQIRLPMPAQRSPLDKQLLFACRGAESFGKCSHIGRFMTGPMKRS
jgi:hypothetical protein